MLIATKKGLRHKLSYFHKKQIRSTTMASNVRQKSRTLEAYCCLRGLENEVTSDFCLAPFIKHYFVVYKLLELVVHNLLPLKLLSRFAQQFYSGLQ